MKVFLKEFLVLVCISFFSYGIAQKQNVIHPGETWPDTDGNHIQAHGGALSKQVKHGIGMESNAGRG